MYFLNVEQMCSLSSWLQLPACHCEQRESHREDATWRPEAGTHVVLTRQRTQRIAFSNNRVERNLHSSAAEPLEEAKPVDSLMPDFTESTNPFLVLCHLVSGDLLQ